VLQQYPEMIVKKTLILFIALFFTCSAGLLYSQSAYVNTQQGIFQLTGGPGKPDRLLINNDCGIDSTILSIAMYKDTVYYNTWAGELKRFKPGVPGSCETLIESGFSYTAMTVDKNGIIYMGTELLAKYNPHTRQLTHLGRMPFFSAGDMIFFKDKLLLAGWDPYDWSAGIFEIDPDNLLASKLYMSTPPFIGLLSFPVPCSNSRYFGLSSGNTNNTQLTELDLFNKKVIGSACSIPMNILDAASNTETGPGNGISINSIVKTNPDNCQSNAGSIIITASSANGPVTYTLVNSGLSQLDGKFANLRGGLYNFRIANADGCTKDTSIVLTENSSFGCSDIFIPNAFTPNNDGKNDLFNLSVPSGFKDISLQIFNRWGTTVYQGNGNNVSWNGNYNGTNQPPGVYVYVVNYTDNSALKKNLKGSLTLIR
jgi:gliding motility-associated-like protein